MVATSATPEHAAIRIRLEGGKDKSLNEILTEAKKVIPGVYAVRPLKSGDIDIMVPDQATKDRILNQPEIEGCKILQQDYLIKVPWSRLACMSIVDRKWTTAPLSRRSAKGQRGLSPE